MDINGHNYSGWPGAYCLNCGQEDPEELELADIPEEELTHLRVPCKKPKELND
jgi:hypothetical protein